jgi:hypothetical protein
MVGREVGVGGMAVGVSRGTRGVGLGGMRVALGVGEMDSGREQPANNIPAAASEMKFDQGLIRDFGIFVIIDASFNMQ